MKDFLKYLVNRSLGTMPVVQPRVPSLFEPPIAYDGSFGEASWGRDESRLEAATLAGYRDGSVENAELNAAAAPGPHPGRELLPAGEGRRLPLSESHFGEAKQIWRPQQTAAMSPSLAEHSGTREADFAAEIPSQGEALESALVSPSRPLLKGAGKMGQQSLQPNRKHEAGFSAEIPSQRGALESALVSPSRPLVKGAGKIGQQSLQPNRKAEAPSNAEHPQRNIRPDSFEETYEPTEPPRMPARAEASRAKPVGKPYARVEPRVIQRFDFRRHIPPPALPRPADPMVQVTIGRVEVRAVSAQSSRRTESSTSPVTSLKDYLRQRSKRGEA